jgi:TolB protein
MKQPTVSSLPCPSVPGPRRAPALTSRFAPTLALLGLPVFATTALAQPAAPADDLPQIRITDPNRNLFKLGLPNAVGDVDLAAEALGVERRALEIVGLFNVLDPKAFFADLQKEGLSFSSALWSQVGAQGVAKLRAAREGGQIAVEGRLYQTGRGDTAVLTKTYRGPTLRPLVHKWVNDVIAQLTGQPGTFGSRIAFALTGRSSEIATVGSDGSEMKTITAMKADCLMPAFSPTGGEVAFTSFLRGTPDLWVVSAAGGRARRLSSRPGMNTGAVFAPDGGSLVVTLSYEGSADLYRLSPSDGRVLGRITSGRAADLSADFSPDGSQIAFVSDRGGTPQVYVVPASGGNPRRLTFQGSYNQTPRWNPNPQRPAIAFTGRDERGVFDIFYFDLKTQKVERVTQNKGSNSSPDWSPDGRLLVYASTRGGLFVANPETRSETQIWKGSAASPSWGPAPR